MMGVLLIGTVAFPVQAKDSDIREKTITYQTKDGAVYVTSRCVCLENIAQEAPLTLPEEPENSENIGVFVGNVQGNG